MVVDIVSSNARVAGSAAVVVPWHARHELWVWQVAQSSGELAAMVPCFCTQPSSWTMWLGGRTPSVCRSRWQVSHLFGSNCALCW